jgi:acyl carrier protein
MLLSAEAYRFQRPRLPFIFMRRRVLVYQGLQKIAAWPASRRRSFRIASYDGIKAFNKKARLSMSVRSEIIAALRQVAEEQKVTLPPLNDDLSLHETGFDSLAFAILVARLEDQLGVDPFTLSEDATFPLTIGDFIKAYENVPA